MTDERVKEITQTAYILWQSFEERYPVWPDFLHTQGKGIAQLGQRFFRHCAELILGVRAGSVVFADLRGHPLESKHPRQESWSGQPASWLFHAGGDIPTIVIDKRHISHTLPNADINRIVQKLILHETGHVVLHWRNLVTRSMAASGPSTTVQEAEAWIFVGILQGLITAGLCERARASYPPKYDDATWKSI